MQRNWTRTGEQYFREETLGGPPWMKPDQRDLRGHLAGVFERMTWRQVPCEVSFTDGWVVREACEEFGIVPLRVAVSADLAPHGLTGIEFRRKDGLVRLYTLDDGMMAIPLATDFFPDTETN